MPRLESQQRPTQTRQRLQISPQGYFWNFCEVHGRPVDDGKRLIFPDGWVWENNRSYNSVEKPPPSDERELRQLQIIYQTILVHELRQAHNEFAENVRVMYERSKQLSAPLSVEVWLPNSQGYMRPQAQNIDWLFVENDLRHSLEELKEAEARLEALHKEPLI